MTVMTPQVTPMTRHLAQRNDELQKENDALREIIQTAALLLDGPEIAFCAERGWVLVEAASKTLARAGDAAW